MKTNDSSNKSKFIIIIAVLVLLTCLYVYFLSEQKQKEEIALNSIYKGTQITTPTSNELYVPAVKNSFNEALNIALAFKQKIENENAYKLFYSNGELIRKKEADIHHMFNLACSNTLFDVNHEPNNGFGAPDFKFSLGNNDKTIVEIKLASNSKLKHFPKQVEAYLKANTTTQAIKIIVYFTKSQQNRVNKILNELGLINDKSIVVIDARNDNKIAASNKV